MFWIASLALLFNLGTPTLLHAVHAQATPDAAQDICRAPSSVAPLKRIPSAPGGVMQIDDCQQCLGPTPLPPLPSLRALSTPVHAGLSRTRPLPGRTIVSSPLSLKSSPRGPPIAA